MAYKMLAFGRFNAVSLFTRFAVKYVERPARPAFKEQYFGGARSVAAAMAASIYRGLP